MHAGMLRFINLYGLENGEHVNNDVKVGTTRFRSIPSPSCNLMVRGEITGVRQLLSVSSRLKPKPKM